MPFFLFSQENDFQTWNSIELVYKKLKKTQILFESGVRFDDNSTTVSKCFIDLSVKKKYDELFSYYFGYRSISDKNNDLVFEKKKRFYIDTYFKKSISKRVKFNLRTRIQSQINSGFSFSQSRQNKLRNKVKFVYDFDKINLDLFLALETFYFIGSGFEKIRYVSGFEKPISKKIDLNISFMVQQNIENIVDELWFVFRGKLCYQI